MERALHVGREAVRDPPAPAASPALSASAGRCEELGELDGNVDLAVVDYLLACLEAGARQSVSLPVRGGHLKLDLELVRDGPALQPLVLHEDLLHDLADSAQGHLAGVREPRHRRAIHRKWLV